ncbi:HTH arsR-type domain-containing protein [Stackebrandtia soli]
MIYTEGMDAESLFPPETGMFLKALASETRQQILYAFVSGSTFTVGEVAERCGIGQSTASEQLGILRRGGLLVASRDGKQVHYKADPDTIRARLSELEGFLSRCCPPTEGRVASPSHASGK